jgi:peptide/nickel transport system substrate-binding protein
VHARSHVKGLCRRRSCKRGIALVVVAVLASSLAACGGAKQSGGAVKATKITLTPGKKGGHLTYLAAADIDYLDPGQTYYTFGYMIQEATNRALYSYKPDDSSTPVPDLATDVPEISSDNKTITVHIRKGVMYSPPLQDREVKAADIKYAIERAFTKQVPSGYAGIYFGDLVGAPAEPNTTDYQPISGIETPDDYTLVLHLKTATAPSVSQALVLPITVPVPQDYAQEFDSETPSTYDRHVVFTGPYMVKSDASGTNVGRKPGKLIQLVRNPSWDGEAQGDFRPAYLDSIDVQEGFTDSAISSKRALNGSGTVCCDAGSPPVDVVKEALSNRKDQLTFVASGITRYIALNTTIKPFDNLNVRKAVLAGMNRNALRLTRGGALFGDIATGWLPPATGGFVEAGGLKQGSEYDFNSFPDGNPELAKQYMLKAKAEGVPVTDDGTYAGTEELLMIGANVDPHKKAAEVAQNQLEQLGFKVKLRLVPRDTLDTKFCGVPKAGVAICPNAAWLKDFSDPQSLLEPIFSGDNILQEGNINYPQLDDPAINKAMDEAALLPAGKERLEAWAKINDMIIAAAPAVPWMWNKEVLVGSSDVNLVPNPYTAIVDLNYSSIK